MAHSFWFFAGFLLLLALGRAMSPSSRSSAHFGLSLVSLGSFALQASALAAAPTLTRTWTDAEGGRVEAEFVDSTRGEVWLRTVDGQTFNVPIGRLSPADQRYVTELLRSEREARRAVSPNNRDAIAYGPPRELARLESSQLAELSGMAASRRQPGLFWAHNDSGGDARLHLFDRRGRDLGSCRVAGVRNFDWEDLAGFSWNGKHYLLIADTGNNGLSAAVHMLHLVEEPPCDTVRGVLAAEIGVERTIEFYFEDDLRNCEAVAVDPTDRSILLVSKERSATCHAYRLAWPEPAVKLPLDVASAKATTDAASEGRKSGPAKELPKRPLVARLLGELNLRQVTGMDVSPDGRRAIVLTYGDGFEYAQGGGDLGEGFFASTAAH